MLRKAPTDPRQKTAAKQARVIPTVPVTTVRKWREGESISVLSSRPSQIQNQILSMHRYSRSKAALQSPPRICTPRFSILSFFSIHGVPFPISRYLLLSSSPPYHLFLKNSSTLLVTPNIDSNSKYFFSQMCLHFSKDQNLWLREWSIDNGISGIT